MPASISSPRAKPPLDQIQSLASLHRCLSDEEVDELDEWKPRSRLSMAWKPVSQALHHSKGRRLVGDFIDSHAMHMFMGVLIVVNSVLVISQTDSRADDRKIPIWQEIASTLLLTAFILELGCRIYAQQRKFFLALFNLVELIIVAGDSFLTLYSWCETDTLSVGYLRLMRLARFFRILRLLSGFRELFMMLHGMQSAMKAMAWSILMVSVVIIIWSIIAVEFVRPSVQRLHDDGKFRTECWRCGRAFNSVWDASLTLMSTTIAGDAWGEIAIPMMETHPESSLFFLGSFMMINLGLMNLIMAVIVDRAAEARREDEEHTLHEKKQAFQHARLKLFKLCRRLDLNRDGILSAKELRDGVFNEPEFADILKLMDVTMEDLDQVFQYLDMDQSGEITYKEFIHQLHRLKTADSHTVLILLGQQVKQIFHKLDSQIVNLRRSLSPAGNTAFVSQSFQCQSFQCQPLMSADECRSEGTVYKSEGKNSNHVLTPKSNRATDKELEVPVTCFKIGEPKDVMDNPAVRDSFNDHILQQLESLDVAMNIDMERLRQTLRAHIATASVHSHRIGASDDKCGTSSGSAAEMTTQVSSTELAHCSSKEELNISFEGDRSAAGRNPLRSSGALGDRPSRYGTDDSPQTAGLALTVVRKHFPQWPRIQL